MKKNYDDLKREEAECCGCGACFQICPKDAIRMEKDGYGFSYPVIDEEKCIGCSKCVEACSFKNRKKRESDINPLAFAAIDRCNESLKRSASGGVFAATAKYILEEEGYVFGAALVLENGQISVKHIEICDINSVQLLQGSKYVQSDIGKTYIAVRQRLQEGKKVLFCGTPCQVDGLKGFLKKDYQNLYTIDLICHGVPSMELLRSYIEKMEQKNHMKVTNIEFRNKDFGWGLLAKIDFVNKYGKEESKHYLPIESSYYKMFLEGLIYRKSCYNCKYTSNQRTGDITIGDYWGIGKIYPDMPKEKIDRGVSCLLINTEKGNELVKQLDIEIYEANYDEIKKENHQLYTSVKFPDCWETIMENYKSKGYSAIEEYYKKTWKKERYVMNLKRTIPTPVKDLLKTLKK